MLTKVRLWHLAVVLILVTVGSLFLGRYPTPGFLSLSRLLEDDLARRLVLSLRLPRVIAGLFLGFSLAAAGTVFQMILSNPLVEPGFLGVSPGAAFGAAFCIVFFTASPIVVQAAALICALAGLALSYFLAKLFRYGGWILRLVLAGIAISALFSAAIGLVKFAADPLSELPEITFWLLGGLWTVTWRELLFVLPGATVGLAVAFLFRWKLNVLSLDGSVAHSLGESPGRARLALLFSATLATSAVVSVSGIVGWAGLMIPHVSRRVFGSDAKTSLPASMVLGGIYILICDDVARTLLPAEIPLGILTSFVGAVVFVVLMTTRRRSRGG